MPRGYVYVTRSAKPRGDKSEFRSVPTEWGERLYFGPCKKHMRPKVRAGDWIFGITPSGVPTRRLVFAMEVAERITFAEAFLRYPDLHGPVGPINVRPVRRPGAFPFNSYEHIPGSAHPEGEKDAWPTDLGRPEMDAFLVGAPADGWKGRWLGPLGPKVDDSVLALLRGMSLHGEAGPLAPFNTDATRGAPIAHGRLYTGLHLETDDPEPLLRLLDAAMAGVDLPEEALGPAPVLSPSPGACSPSIRSTPIVPLPLRRRRSC